MAGSVFSLIPTCVPMVETKFRKIKTMLPVPESLPILQDIDQYESRSMHGQMPIVWDKAKDFQVWDIAGNCWIDFTSTIFVANAGHSNQKLIAALKEQLDKPLLHTYTYPSKIRAEYLRYLIQATPAQFEKAFLLSAGTEATECALKLMRMYGQKKEKRRPCIIAFEGNWHGRTLGAQMMSYNPSQKAWIGYTDPNIFHLPFPYPWREEAIKNPRQYFHDAMNALLEEQRLDPQLDLCGFMLETLQGWGSIFYPEAFVQEVQKFAKEHNMLVTYDEMQAGFGRTGKLFGYMHYNVEPDLLCCGKGAGSGVPLSIVLGSKEVMDLPEIGSMSSTHSANPLVCAAGLASIKALLEDGLIENANKLGKIFQERLQLLKSKYPTIIRHTMGKGLIAAIHFVDEAGNPLAKLCDQICEVAMQKGLLVVHTGRESIKLAPPLCITEEALLEGLDVLEESIVTILNKVAVSETA